MFNVNNREIRMTSVVIVLLYLLLTLNVFNIVFFIWYLPTPQATLGHYQGDTLNFLMLITVFCLSLMWRAPERPNKVRSLMFHFYTHWKIRNGILPWNWHVIVLLVLTLKIINRFSIYRLPSFSNTKEVGIFALFIITWNLIKISS